jgi:hypothetical protein
MNSNNNIQDTSSTASEQDEVDKFINSTSKYVNLPKRDGESSVYQFSKDKTKKKLVTKTFTDPITHQPAISNIFSPCQICQINETSNFPSPASSHYTKFF